MKKSLFILCGVVSLSAHAQTITLDAYVFAGGTAYNPISNVATSNDKGYDLGTSESASSKMLDIMRKAGCHTMPDETNKPDCRIKVELNKKKDTIIKIISAQKITNS